MNKNKTIENIGIYKLSYSYYYFLKSNNLTQMDFKLWRQYVNVIGFTIEDVKYIIPLTSDKNDKWEKRFKYNNGGSERKLNLFKRFYTSLFYG